jgi:hypothetical protein
MPEGPTISDTIKKGLRKDFIVTPQNSDGDPVSLDGYVVQGWFRKYRSACISSPLPTSIEVGQIRIILDTKNWSLGVYEIQLDFTPPSGITSATETLYIEVTPSLTP